MHVTGLLHPLRTPIIAFDREDGPLHLMQHKVTAARLPVNLGDPCFVLLRDQPRVSGTFCRRVRLVFCRAMPRLRRLTALLVSSFLAHAMWAGSGFVCTMSEMHDPSPAMAALDTAGEGMPGMDMAGTTHPAGDLGHAPPHDHSPCNLPWSPGGCKSMAPCGPTALATSPEPVRVPAAVPSALDGLAILTPPSATRSPEPPPPRA